MTEKDKYISFTEVNDWEGETWIFYINLELNEKHLDLLKTLSERIEKSELNVNEFSGKNYEFDFNPITEDQFESNEADDEDEEENSYMDKVNLIETELKVGKLKHVLTWDEDLFFDALYKGKIAEFF